MKNYLLKINRLWAGRADVRSHTWESAKKRKMGLKFKLDVTGDTMTIPFERLDEGEHRTTKVFPSRMGGQPYYLISFLWKSDKPSKNVVLKEKSGED